MQKSAFNKFVLLAGLLSMFGVNSSKQLKASEAGKRVSLSKYSGDNFNSLPMKRVNGKWRVKQ